MEHYHRPVLLKEVLELINFSKGGVYADLTFGEGGHSGALVQAGAARVVAWDRDLEALETYRAGGELRADPRLELHHGRFSTFAGESGEKFDGILLDLGVSTRQLLRPERGFSFSAAGPLDMRMNQSEGESLLDYLERVGERELAESLQRNADIPHSLDVAKRLLAAFRRGEIQDTQSLVRAIGGKPGPRHPGTVIFLALRMAVNDELGEVERSLPLLVKRLKPGGRLAVITFHSTEDRMVKRGFRLLAGQCGCPPQAPICQCPKVAKVLNVLKKPLAPTREECRVNPRSRSAKLRCVEALAN